MPDGSNSFAPQLSGAEHAARRSDEFELLDTAQLLLWELDHLHGGIQQIAGSGQAPFLDLLARVIGDTCEALRLQDAGRLRAAKALGRRLKSAIETALAGHGLAGAPARRSRQRAVSLLSVPLRLQLAWHRTAASASLDPNLRCERALPPPTEQLAQVFGFSAAEAGLAHLLLQGLPLGVAARRLQLGLPVARLQLQQLLLKLPPSSRCRNESAAPH